MRDFNETDRKKKKGRITLPENPSNLSEGRLKSLEEAVRAAMKDGYVPCPAAWRVAKDLGVSRLDVGVMIDKLGVRVINCQLGCFKVEKTSRPEEAPAPINAGLAARVEELGRGDGLTCPAMFSIAEEEGVKPLAVADAANSGGLKISGCQLGCF